MFPFPAVVSSSSGTSSKSISPTADLAKYKFDHKETYPISDVLICHTDQEYRTCVVWVIRSKAGQLEAIVFECPSEEDVKDVYRKFLEVSKRCKLERHRRRKSDGGSVMTRSVEALFKRGDKTKSVVMNNEVIVDSKQQQQHSQHASSKSLMDPQLQNRWSLVQHTDKNGVTHIEVESATKSEKKEPASGGHQPQRSPFMSFPTSNQEQQPSSVSSSSSTKVIKARQQTMTEKKSQFAKELENILSKELETRKVERDFQSIHAAVQHTNSTGSQPVLPSTTSITISNSPSTNNNSSSNNNSNNSKSKGGAIPRVRPNGESLSLRQRAPALLLKKLDEFEEKAHRVWAKAEAQAEAKALEQAEREREEENRKIWNKPSKMASRTPPPPSKRHHENNTFWKSRYKDTTPATSSPSTGLKLRAPSPPPDIGRHSVQSSPAVTNRKEQQQQQSNIASTNSPSSNQTTSNGASSDKQILVPTKTGKEPVKKLYPKEINPELQIRAAVTAGRFVHLAPITQMHQGAPAQIPVQFAAQQFAAQPHSLPIYPVQITTTTPIAWARYPTDFNDPNNNLQQLLQAQWAVSRAAQPIVVTAAPNPMSPTGSVSGRGRSRDRARIDTDQRRRAQSKSPARKPSSGTTKYADMTSENISGISRRFREFSDAFKQKMSRKASTQMSPGQPQPQLHTPHTVPMPDQTDGPQQQLKSNLKKFDHSQNPGLGSDSPKVSSAQASHASSSDSKKVHFNKFATVQMME